MAFQSGSHNPLMDLLLAVSALHLRLLDPSDESVTFASYYYFDLAVKKSTELLPKLSEENSCLLFASASLIALRALLSRQEMPLEEHYVLPTTWFRTLRGVRTVTSVARPWILKSKLRPMLLDAWFPNPPGPQDEDKYFTNLLPGPEDKDLKPEHEEAYRDAVKQLSLVYAFHRAGEDLGSIRRRTLVFPMMVSSEFVSLLENSDPRALVITAHFFALIKYVDRIWWLHGVARREILGLATVVPKDWMWAMEWPLMQI